MITTINEFKTYQELKSENKSILPKIDVNTIFINTYKQIDYKYNYILNTIENNKYFKKQKVNIENIIPTQKYLNINNLLQTKNISRDTDAQLLKIKSEYFIIDGHHRIATRILNGDSYIYANVLQLKTFIGTCDRLRINNPQNDTFWHIMIKNKSEISKSEFLQQTDITSILDEDETFDEFMNNYSGSYFKSIWNNNECTFIKLDAGFEYIFI